jgi:uncharacterized phosphosugar-binding protein
MRYFDHIYEQLKRAEETQAPTIARAADALADILARGGLIYTFGSTHAGILSEELFYRAGGLVPIVPIFAPGLTTDVRPITLTSELERKSGYAEMLLDASGLTAADALIVHSVSGRNTVAIEMAEGAKSRGALVIALTSVAYSAAVKSRHSKGVKLMDAADIVIDNCGVVGDAVVKLDGLPQAVGPTSTIVGAALLNTLVVEIVARLLQRGIEPPVFLSANLDAGDAYNKRLLDKYKGRLNYL